MSVLREKLNRSTKEAAEVEFHLNKAQETITAAESLVTKLEGEYQRWSQQVRLEVMCEGVATTCVIQRREIKL